MSPSVTVTTPAPLTPSTLKKPAIMSPNSLQYPPGYLGAAPGRSNRGEKDNEEEEVINAMGYLTNILSSKVYDVAIESPLQLAPKLSERLRLNVWLKREDLQPVSSLLPFVLRYSFLTP